LLSARFSLFLQAPRWLHTVADVESAPSIPQLAELISQPSRYDYPYLATALNRLAVLSEQQQQQDVTSDPPSTLTPAEQQQLQQQQQQQRRLAKMLIGRLRQLQADATAVELPIVLTAAEKLGVYDGRFFATAAAAAVAPENLAGASDAYIASIMSAVAAFASNSSSSSSSGQGSSDFSRKQQQGILRKCLARLVQLIEQQQKLQQQQLQPRSLAAAAAAAITGRDAVGADGAAGVQVQPANVILALWAAATAGVTATKQLRLSAVFDLYLSQQAVLQQLLGSSSSSRGTEAALVQSSQQQQQSGPAATEVVSTCGTVIWAAAQLGYTGSLHSLQPYAKALLDVVHSTPSGYVDNGACLTVAQAMASLINRQQQQQERGGVKGDFSSSGDVQFWKSSLLQCSGIVLTGLQQQQQEQEGQEGQEGLELIAAAAAQLLAAYDEAGLRPSEEQLQILMLLREGQVSVCENCVPGLYGEGVGALV
jgi:hypothetical protein